MLLFMIVVDAHEKEIYLAIGKCFSFCMRVSLECQCHCREQNSIRLIITQSSPVSPGDVGHQFPRKELRIICLFIRKKIFFEDRGGLNLRRASDIGPIRLIIQTKMCTKVKKVQGCVFSSQIYRLKTDSDFAKRK